MNKDTTAKYKPRYISGVFDTLFVFLRLQSTADAELEVEQLWKHLDSIFTFVGLDSDGEAVMSSAPQDLSWATHRNRMCHMLLFLRFLLFRCGRQWENSTLHDRCAVAVRLLKSVARRQVASPEKVLGAVQESRDISRVYPSLVRAGRRALASALVRFHLLRQEGATLAKMRSVVRAVQSALIGLMQVCVCVANPPKSRTHACVCWMFGCCVL